MTTCGLCHGLGRIKEYEDEWLCPCCHPQHDFYTIRGLKFKDWEGIQHDSFQMVSHLDASAYMILDFTGETVTRFLFADSVRERAIEWRDGIFALRKAEAELARNPVGLDRRDVLFRIQGAQEAINFSPTL